MSKGDFSKKVFHGADGFAPLPQYPELNNNWILQSAETDLVWTIGSVYPVAIVCTVYEVNGAGEKRLVEQRTLNIENPELQSNTPNSS